MPYHPKRGYQRHRTGGAILVLQSSLEDQVGRNSPVNDTQYLAHRLRVGGEKVSQRERKTDDPLAQWYIGKYFIREKGRCLGHAAGAIAGTGRPTESAPLARECYRSFEMAFVAAHPEKAVFEAAALQVGFEFPVNMVGQGFALLGQLVH